ncbi:MAG TPA: NUDIX domain-containing protein [Candidatus Aquilonibacter sp.]|nr:NUDIX domain-containing protein [Candidatus Aquilonibacter sp.]
MRVSSIRKLSKWEQVAAVCYRVRGEIEFLLVRTRSGGRWTFPKGGVELGLTPAQVAALEAFEEAGVHGRIEQTSFARYVSRKSGKSKRSCVPTELIVHAYLCEVLRLARPKEPGRDRTWFSAEEARRQLRQGRDKNCAAAVVNVIEKAILRIEHLQREYGSARRTQPDGRERFARWMIEKDSAEKDALQKVQFEAKAQVPGWTTRGPLLPKSISKSSAMQPYSLAPSNQPRKLLPGDVLPFNVAPPAAIPHSNRARNAIAPGSNANAKR